jgi:hypothetical protein
LLKSGIQWHNELSKFGRYAVCPILFVFLSVAVEQVDAHDRPSGSTGRADAERADHIVIKSEQDLKTVFTFFPYPYVASNELPPARSGLYRLDVSPDGTVSAVTILSSMGQSLDVRAMKAFIKWKAKPGRPRLVDVGWRLWQRAVGGENWH